MPDTYATRWVVDRVMPCLGAANTCQGYEGKSAAILADLSYLMVCRTIARQPPGSSAVPMSSTGSLLIRVHRNGPGQAGVCLLAC
jgi:hypothetical protein